MQEIVDKSKDLDVEQNQLVVDILGIVCSYFPPARRKCFVTVYYYVGPREESPSYEESRSRSALTFQNRVICQSSFLQSRLQTRIYYP